MKYIIMCGGTYEEWETPRQLLKLHGEEIVARTIRLLRENGVEDIAISSDNPVFRKFGVPVLEHENNYIEADHNNITGYWVDAFYPMNFPVCYLLGDVVFSLQAIKTIVETKTDDIEMFASKPPFSVYYCKPWAEPFALKVVNTEHLKNAISLTKQYEDRGLFTRKAIMWELWQVIQAAPLNWIDYNSFVAINDYTCDVDDLEHLKAIEECMYD